MVDSGLTPGGCWAHFSVIRMPGFKELVAGQEVELEHEPAEQDGYAFRALGVWPAGTSPEDDPVAEGPSAGYRSELRITGENPL